MIYPCGEKILRSSGKWLVLVIGKITLINFLYISPGTQIDRTRILLVDALQLSDNARFMNVKTILLDE